MFTKHELKLLLNIIQVYCEQGFNSTELSKIAALNNKINQLHETTAFICEDCGIILNKEDLELNTYRCPKCDHIYWQSQHQNKGE